MLPDTNAQAAQMVAERCRNLIFKEQIAHAASSVGQLLTISLGVGTVIPTHSTSALAFIEEVDQQLYRAKANGRNCIANMSR